MYICGHRLRDFNRLRETMEFMMEARVKEIYWLKIKHIQIVFLMMNQIKSVKIKVTMFNKLKLGALYRYFVFMK